MIVSKSRFLIMFAALICLAAPLGDPVAAAGDGTSQQGCKDQWLFNGVWRVQVTDVQPYATSGQQTGWQVTEVWRNGYSQEAAPGDSELKDQKLTLADGSSILASATSSGAMSMSVIASHDFAPSAQLTFTQVFVAANVNPSNKPAAVDIIFDGAKLAMYKATGARGFHPQFSTPHYNFHYKLDCVATGAAAQAQGGSSEIAATHACMNQWLSNGIWKMRATAIAPDNNNDPTSPQIGWMITQDWVNLTSRSLAPSDVYQKDEYLVTASGNNIPSSNSAGTSMNMQQLSYHSFPPGGSFTYQQRFRWAPFSVSDKPTKLLVTFDAKSNNARAGWPHYTMPGNFRIDLTCRK